MAEEYTPMEEELQDEVVGEEPEAVEEPQEEEPPAEEEEPEAEEEACGLEKKSGPELFKEVLRLLDTAEPEDYFKNGRWDDVLMRMDVVLLDGHRREAGAPEPPDIKDVELPASMPTAPSAFGLGGQPGMFGVRPVTAVTAVTAAGAVGNQAAELRLISLFVAKWQLDPTPTKTCFAKLTPTRRRYVIQSFKTTEKGEGAAEELKEYIAKCEQTNAWAGAEKAAAMAAARPALTPQRPASAPPAWAGTPLRPAVGSIQRPSVLGGVRPMGSAAVRPMGQAMGPIGLVKPVASPVGLKRPITSVSGPVSTAAAVRQRIAAQALGARFPRPAAVAPRPVTPFGAGASCATIGAGSAAQGRASIRPVTPGALKPATSYAPRAGALTPRPAAVRSFSAPARPAAPTPAGQKPGGLIRGLLQRL